MVYCLGTPSDSKGIVSSGFWNAIIRHRYSKRSAFLLLLTAVVYLLTILGKTKFGATVRMMHWNGTSAPNGTAYGKNVSCTHGLFRAYYKAFGRLPKGGQWVERDRTEVHVSYRSDVCRLKYTRLPPAFMKKCFAKANVSAVVTLGDSNGQRYFHSLIEDMKSFSRECRVIRREVVTGDGAQPGVAYFARSLPREIYRDILVSHFRYCGGCGAATARCLWKSSAGTRGTNKTDAGGGTMWRTVVEHLPATMVLPTSLRILVRPEVLSRMKATVAKYYAQSSVEFFFKYYLSGRYPDVMIVFLPFNHVKFIDLRRVRIDIVSFHALVKLYIPRSTKVFYMPSFAEFEEPRKGSFWMNKRVDGLLAWQRINILNQILYDVIKDDLFNATSGIYSFLDLLDMSKDRLKWNRDGIHMNEQWYSSVIRNFWEVFCNSVLNNDF